MITLKSLISEIDPGKKRYSWQDPRGNFLPIKSSHAQDAYVITHEPKDPIMALWKRGYMRITHMGNILMAHNEVMPPNNKQKSELINLATIVGDVSVEWDDGEDNKIIWSEYDVLEEDIINELQAYHGTISDFVDKIKASGKLISTNAGAKKVSGGYTTEGGLIWVTPNFNTANYYADGLESNNEFNIKSGLKCDYGGVFEVTISDDLKLIDYYGILTSEQIDILNSKFVPKYKPVESGATFRDAVLRSNGKPIHDMIKSLGFDGMYVGKNKLQIAIATDELPIVAFHRKKG